MITTDDIKHLADLARIKLSDEETESMTSEIDAILGYVGQITSSTGDLAHIIPTLRNVMREDIPTHTSGQYTEAILSNAPAREGNMLKVKKIL